MTQDLKQKIEELALNICGDVIINHITGMTQLRAKELMDILHPVNDYTVNCDHEWSELLGAEKCNKCDKIIS